jgi:hypothetical protein
LDKLRTLTPSSHVNDLIIAKLEKVDVDRLQTRTLLENYQEHSVDFKFEETLREGEIKEFAKSIMPKPRFIFDNYKVSEDLFSQTAASTTPIPDLGEDNSGAENKADDDNDYFSFFSSHEKIILKPESNFKNMRSFLVNLPIDYYILLQSGF